MNVLSARLFRWELDGDDDAGDHPALVRKVSFAEVAGRWAVKSG